MWRSRRMGRRRAATWRRDRCRRSRDIPPGQRASSGRWSSSPAWSGARADQLPPGPRRARGGATPLHVAFSRGGDELHCSWARARVGARRRRESSPWLGDLEHGARTRRSDSSCRSAWKQCATSSILRTPVPAPAPVDGRRRQDKDRGDGLDTPAVPTTAGPNPSRPFRPPPTSRTSMRSRCGPARYDELSDRTRRTVPPLRPRRPRCAR